MEHEGKNHERDGRGRNCNVVVVPGMVLVGIIKGEFDVVLDVFDKRAFILCGDGEIWNIGVETLRRWILKWILNKNNGIRCSTV